MKYITFLSVLTKYADLEEENKRLLQANKWESDIAEQALQEIARLRVIQPFAWYNESQKCFTLNYDVVLDWIKVDQSVIELYKGTKIE